MKRQWLHMQINNYLLKHIHCIMRYKRKRRTYKSQKGGFSALLRNLGKVPAKIIDKVAPKIIKYAARSLTQVASHAARGVVKVGKAIVHGQPKGWNKYAGASSNVIARNKQDLIPNTNEYLHGLNLPCYHILLLCVNPKTNIIINE